MRKNNYCVFYDEFINNLFIVKLVLTFVKYIETIRESFSLLTFHQTCSRIRIICKYRGVSIYTGRCKRKFVKIFY